MLKGLWIKQMTLKSIYIRLWEHNNLIPAEGAKLTINEINLTGEIYNIREKKNTNNTENKNIYL